MLDAALIALLISFGVMTFSGKVVPVIEMFLQGFAGVTILMLNLFTSLLSLTDSGFCQSLKVYRSTHTCTVLTGCSP